MLLDETYFRKLILLKVHIMAKMQKIIFQVEMSQTAMRLTQGIRELEVFFFNLIILQFKSMTLYNGKEIEIRGKEVEIALGKKQCRGI